MDADLAPDAPWAQISEWIAQKTGLHFPPERSTDLQRGLASAAREFGYTDAAACARWLLSACLTRGQIHALASHLTIGETYFFRERKTFAALAEHVLPQLIRRRSGARLLRLWSAACCTGEEPYSLAILLQQCIPNWRDWRISILATDINERFLQKAAAGVYGEWSFRESPPDFKERYFTRTSDGRFAVLPHIKQWVRFAPLNLAEDPFPSFVTDIHALDLIFCRNVLMYFTPSQARRVVENLRRALRADGWLALSPSESSQVLCRGLAPANFPGTILYQKSEQPTTAAQLTGAPPGSASGAQAEQEYTLFEPSRTQDSAVAPAPVPAQPTLRPLAAAPPIPAYDVARSLYEQGRYAETADTLLATLDSDDQPPAHLVALLARALANQGRLQEALVWCDRWIAVNALDCTARYIRAIVLAELGEAAGARLSLQQALYLHPDFVLAHFALGNLARGGKPGEAHRHFVNALHLLRDRLPEESLPESDGLTAGRLREILTLLISLQGAT